MSGKSETNTLVLLDVEYVGADIVRGLIKFDRERFGNTSRKFLVMDMVTQQPYKAFDLIVTRDALVHLPDRQVKKVLDNFNKVNTAEPHLLLAPGIRTNPAIIEWIKVLIDDVVPRS